MASGLVRCVISSVLEDSDLQLKTARLEKLRGTGTLILERAVAGEACMTAFDKFSEQLTSSINSLFDPKATYRSAATKREKLWLAFHIKLRMTELPKIWSGFLTTIQVECKDQLFQQSVNQKLYEMILCQHFSANTSSAAKSTPRIENLTADELNALQYAAGYVPHALVKKYEKRTGEKYEAFIECLGDMAVVSEDVDFLDYTKKWINKVNRGGLFPLNNITYQFFVEIEKQVRFILPSHATKSSGSTDAFKQDVVKKIADNEGVQWHWTLISQCIDSEEDAVELLHQIVLLWVTIRGFSLAATWMEMYKKSNSKTTKQKKSLRRDLKQSLNDELQ